MSTENVVMPQMGESITEGTIIKWLKKPGEHVERDEPLFEISTDKVDAEIPSPAAGVLTDIKAQEGETVAVSSVVAVIDSNGAAGATTVAPVAESTRQQKAEEKTEEPATTVRSAPPAAPGNPASVPQPVSIPQASSAAAPAKAPDKPTLRAASAEEPQRTRSSPLVRKIAQEHG
ncbi:MAG: biotin/lipoyl-containing protein, partial [Pyrinomonadaceae bacterium]